MKGLARDRPRSLRRPRPSALWLLALACVPGGYAPSSAAPGDAPPGLGRRDRQDDPAVAEAGGRPPPLRGGRDLQERVPDTAAARKPKRKRQRERQRKRQRQRQRERQKEEQQKQNQQKQNQDGPADADADAPASEAYIVEIGINMEEKEIFDTVEVEMDVLCSDLANGELSFFSKTNIESALRLYFNDDAAQDPDTDAVYLSMTLVSFEEAGVCPPRFGEDGRERELQPRRGRRRSVVTANRRTICRMCKSHTPPSDSLIPRHYERDRNTGVGGGRGRGLQQSPDFAQYFRDAGFGTVQSAEVTRVKVSDCTAQNVCESTTGDFACCGAEGPGGADGSDRCRCNYVSESLCYLESCDVKSLGGEQLCCSTEPGSGLLFPGCTDFCGEACPRQDYIAPAPSPGRNDITVSVEMELLNQCAETDDGDLRPRTKRAFASDTVLYLNSVVKSDGCRVRFVSCEVERFQEADICPGQRQGSPIALKCSVRCWKYCPRGITLPALKWGDR